jgi:ABC-2 type transport system ATP-binding protein
MPFLSIQNVSKTFGNFKANDDVSLDIKAGKIFGLLGPNGAGKTTLIRMLTRILIPDNGMILFDGKLHQDSHMERIGYMPEERGLYKNMQIGEHLEYLAKLKGLDSKQAKISTTFWLEKMDIESWRTKKIDELSKGMSQKVQFIATIIHDPDLIILDEPFSGLDPINGQLIETEIAELKQKGKTVIFSTHRMEQVEQICDEIALINSGKVVLNGNVKELKHQFKKGQYEVVLSENSISFKETEDIKIMTSVDNLFVISSTISGSQLLRDLLSQPIDLVSFREILPTIQEIFIEKVKSNHA